MENTAMTGRDYYIQHSYELPESVRKELSRVFDTGVNNSGVWVRFKEVENLAGVMAYEYTHKADVPDKNVGEWISVEERLPEEYEEVLCYYEYFRYGEYNCMFRTIDRGYYGLETWCGEAGRGHKNKVLYWQPLPEPPEEG